MDVSMAGFAEAAESADASMDGMERVPLAPGERTAILAAPNSGSPAPRKAPRSPEWRPLAISCHTYSFWRIDKSTM